MSNTNNDRLNPLANQSSKITGKLPEHGTIPDIVEFIVFTKQSAEIMAKTHGALKTLLPEFKTALDTAFYSFIGFQSNMQFVVDANAIADSAAKTTSDSKETLKDPSKLVESKENPMITHQNNIKNFLAVAKKMNRAITKEKFQSPLFWGAVALSVLVLTAGAAMFAMPAYVAAGFVCIFAGFIALFITTLQMRTGSKHPYDKKFFKHCDDVAKYMNRPLEGAGNIQEFIPKK